MRMLVISFAMVAQFFPMTSQAVPVSMHDSQVETVFGIPKGLPEAHGIFLIETELIRLMDSTIADGEIYMSMYTHNLQSISDALLRAAGRGVRVSIVYDGGMRKSKDGAITSLTKKAGNLTATGMKNLKVVFCNSSCNGSHINHTKLFLFSRLTDGRENLVALTSANMTGGQLANFNDLAIVSGNQGLYKYAQDFWNDLALNDGKLQMPKEYWDGRGVGIYAYPRKRERDLDPMEQVLQNLDCSPPGGVIRVMQSRFDDDRFYIAKLLAELKKQGCDVEVMVRQEPDKLSPGKDVRAAIAPFLFLIPYKEISIGGVIDGHLTEQVEKYSIHSKLLIIRGTSKNTHEMMDLVFMGSHNLNGTSLSKNDELQFRIDSAEVVDRYLKFYQTVKSFFSDPNHPR